MTGPAFLAEIAVALPVDGTFSYRLPSDPKDAVRPGHRVLVPFGARRVTGYVLSLTADPPAGLALDQIKTILRPLDEHPLFRADLTDLFRFVARYYHYPIGQAIAEALPSGLKVMSRTQVRLTPDGLEAKGRTDLPPREHGLLAALSPDQPADLARLTKDKTATPGLIRKLEARGWISTDTGLSRDRVRPKTERWVHLFPQTQENQVRLGPREKELMEVLADAGPMPLSGLKDRFSGIHALVRQLSAKGLLAIEEKALVRDALGRALSFEQKAPMLSTEQKGVLQAVATALDRRTFAPFTLFGITGSGKTEVYLAAARKALDSGRTVLFLVPEISLTPALEGLLRTRFEEEVAVLHSGLSDGERYDQWMKILHGQASIVLGARSAVFAPLSDLGLIVVDEEHDSAYKQEDKLRYQARDLALYRGRQSSAAVILGSATPSLETFHAANVGRYARLNMLHRVGSGRLPRVDIVDMRLDSGRRRKTLTPILKQALEETLADKRQALLFINRRGLAALPICLSCGFVLKCVNCSVSLTLHQKNETKEKEHLICHYCGYETQPPSHCPQCASPLWRYMGLGTEKLEKAVQEAFPQARVGRLDADTARPKGALTEILKNLKDHHLDILVGTQMVTKGHDFPGITLVGVLDADLGLHRPDFRAAERTFQLLAQVSGRAGRGKDPGRVIVQTFNPEHYTLALAKEHDFPSFFHEEMVHREELGYPPFARLVMIGLKGNLEEKTARAAREAGSLGQSLLKQGPWSGVELVGPAPAPLAKVKGFFRFQILVRGLRVSSLHGFLNEWLLRLKPRIKSSGVTLSVDVDPHQMM